MKLVFLVIDYVPHQILSIKNLIENTNAEVLAFHVGRLYETTPNDLTNFSTTLYKSYSKQQLLQKIKDHAPDAIITAGWMIPEYNWVCKQLKKSSNIPIVAMSDTPWYGTWKQKINALISPFHVKKAFTHLWVAGIRQYDYARKLGFSNEQIIFNSLCGDTETFNKVQLEPKKESYPKNFIYIGRFEKIKGLHNLIKAWGSIEDKKGWTFTLIGAGTLKEELQKSEGFIVKDYMTQDKLVAELQNAGCFVLPSLHEPWALVIHEAAIAGLPIICTETCGAAPHFVINNYNGFKIKNNDVDHLQQKLTQIINVTDNQLCLMSENSRYISTLINRNIQIASISQIFS